MSDYIRWIRSLVGHSPIILNFAGAAIVDDSGQVLLQQRGDRANDVWGFPGGAVELGESIETAARREVLEETGLHVSVVELLGIYSRYTDEYPNGDVAQPITIFFRCVVESGSLAVDGGETVGLDYFALDDLPPLVNQQHRDAAHDLLTGRSGVWR